MFLTPKTGWIGVDVGLASVKCAQLVRRQGRLVLGTTASAERPVANLEVAQRSKASLLPFTSKSEISHAALVGQHWRGKSASAVASMSICDVTQAALPGSAESLDADDLEQEFQKAAHTPLAARQTSWWLSAASAKAPPQAMLATLPTAWANRLTQDIADNRWQCRVIDALPWCLSRAIDLLENAGQTSGSDAGLTAALDWGASRATLCLFRNGVPAQVRNLKDCGFEKLSQAVRKELGATPQAVHRLLLETHFAAPATSPACPSTKVLAKLSRPVFAKLEQEIQRTLQFWKMQTRGESPSCLYLFGGGGALLGIADRLASSLQMPCSVWDFPRAVESQDSAPACLFGAAAGLSALAWEKS